MKLQHIQSTDGGFHTIDTERLTIGGWTIDAGCRDFSFSDEMRRLGQSVVALDPAPDVYPKGRELIFLPCALAAHTEYRNFHIDPDPMASHLSDRLHEDSLRVFAFSIDRIQRMLRVQFDCLKLDVEGEEYQILASLVSPPAKQLSIEFHTTSFRSIMKQVVDDTLAQWYLKVWDQPTDVLYVLR